MADQDPAAANPDPTTPSPITLRLPTVYAAPSASTASHTVPSPEWIKGRWYITHSSLPLWKDKRDVALDYALLPPDSKGIVKIEDTTSYRPLSSTSAKIIRGVDTPQGGKHEGAYDWRGYGWLKVASSHWEILGHGDCGAGRQWMVTHFHKTLFTPEGIDIYSREKRGLPAETLAEIRKALGGLEHQNFKKLVDALFEVRQELDQELESGAPP